MSNDNSQQMFFPQTSDTPDKPSETTSPPVSSNAKSTPVRKSASNPTQVFFPQTSSVPQRSGETEQPSTLEKADKAITNTLETNPENLKSLARTNLIEVPKTLGREVYSGIKTIAGMPSAIYHAAADEATPEEKEQYAQQEKEAGEDPGTETSGFKRIGLTAERLLGVSAGNPLKAYGSAATRPSYEQILENAPEALGQGAGTVVAAEAAPKIVRGAKGVTSAGIGKIADVASKVKGPDTSTLGGVLTDEAKQYALRQIPGYDVVKTAKRIANKISALKEAENASALGKSAEPETGSIASRTAKPAPTDPNLVDNSYIPSRTAKPTAETKPGYKPIVPAEEPALKPIGTKTAEPVAEEPAEVRQARHVLGNVAVDKLKTAEGGPEALRRLTTGTHQQFSDLANALDIKKPAYLAEKNGEAWQASEFKRTVKEHGKSLSGPKETVVRELLSKPPAEILQHTNPWVDSTAKYPAMTLPSSTTDTLHVLTPHWA